MTDELPQFPQAPPRPGIPVAERSFQKPLVKLIARMLKPPPKTIRTKPSRTSEKKIKYW